MRRNICTSLFDPGTGELAIFLIYFSDYENTQLLP